MVIISWRSAPCCILCYNQNSKYSLSFFSGLQNGPNYSMVSYSSASEISCSLEFDEASIRTSQLHSANPKEENNSIAVSQTTKHCRFLLCCILLLSCYSVLDIDRNVVIFLIKNVKKKYKVSWNVWGGLYIGHSHFPLAQVGI